MIVSYAQNFEDVILWRALRTITNGRYLDIGAAHPVDDSVTQLFHEHGWSGVNVEPDPNLFKELAQARPGDVNLDVAVADKIGSATLYLSSHPGLTTLDQDIARRLEAIQVDSSQRVVTTTTLACLIDEYLQGEAPHFLKVDAEGSELKIIRGGDWQRHRPWIVVVETAGQFVVDATTTVETRRHDSELAQLMHTHGYRDAYWDGLNTFFVASERPEIADSVAIPPNVFDEFSTLREIRAEQRRAEMEAAAAHANRELIDSDARHRAQLAEMLKEIEWLRTSLDAREDELASSQAALTAMLEHPYWRLSSKLRRMAGRAPRRG